MSASAKVRHNDPTSDAPKTCKLVSTYLSNSPCKTSAPARPFLTEKNAKDDLACQHTQTMLWTVPNHALLNGFKLSCYLLPCRQSPGKDRINASGSIISCHHCLQQGCS